MQMDYRTRENYAYTVLFVFAVLLCLKQKTQDCHKVLWKPKSQDRNKAAKSDPPDRSDSTAQITVQQHRPMSTCVLAKQAA